MRRPTTARSRRSETWLRSLAKADEQITIVSVRGKVRLDRALSKLGLASRADARRLIEAGRVRVSTSIATDPSTLVVPEAGTITVDGRQARAVTWRTIALNKPRGVVTTRRDQEGRKTVFDVIGSEADGLVAIGRLDMASTGLLLMTTDTRLAAAMTDPAYEVVRRYVVTASGFVSDDDARMMERGIDGLQARMVAVRKRSRRETHLTIELTEGKNREIRRLLEAVGHRVTRLLRVSFGPIELGTLQPGEWRTVTRGEVQATRFAARSSDRSTSPAGRGRDQRRARPRKE